MDETLGIVGGQKVTILWCLMNLITFIRPWHDDPGLAYDDTVQIRQDSHDVNPFVLPCYHKGISWLNAQASTVCRVKCINDTDFVSIG